MNKATTQNGRISVSRSRSGCHTCRSRGYKCDETKPICKACSRLGRACKYGPSQTWFREMVPATKMREVKPLHECQRMVRRGGSRDQPPPVVAKIFSRGSTESSSSPERTPEDVVDDNIKFVQVGNCQQKYHDLELDQRGTSTVISLKTSKVANQYTQISSYLSILSNMQPLHRRLLSHWSTHLGPALSSSSTSNTDSFSYFITPMALFSNGVHTALFSALMAVTASHLAQHDSSLEVVSLKEQQRAIKSLKDGIEMNSAVGDESLAAILLLRIFEDFTRWPNSHAAESHSAGAGTLIKARGGPTAFDTLSSRFLLSTLSYYDTISSISLEQSTFISRQPEYNEDSMRSEDDLFMKYTGSILDQLSEISNIVHLFKQAKLLGKIAVTESQQSISEIKNHALKIVPVLHSSNPPTEYSPSHQDYISTAEAYRFAAFIYLYKVLSTYTEIVDIEQIQTSAHSCLEALSCVSTSSPLISRHLYPLFTAACETFLPSERAFAKSRFEAMKARAGGFRNVQRAQELVEDVWLSKDQLLSAAQGFPARNKNAAGTLGCFEVMKAAGKVILIA